MLSKLRTQLQPDKILPLLFGHATVAYWVVHLHGSADFVSCLCFVLGFAINDKKLSYGGRALDHGSLSCPADEVEGCRLTLIPLPDLHLIGRDIRVGVIIGIVEIVVVYGALAINSAVARAATIHSQPML